MDSPYLQHNGLVGDSMMAIENNTTSGSFLDSPMRMEASPQTSQTVTGISSATNIDSSILRPEGAAPLAPTTTALPSPRPAAVDDRLTLRHLRVSAASNHPNVINSVSVGCESEDIIMEQATTPITASAALASTGYATQTEQTTRHNEQDGTLFMDGDNIGTRGEDNENEDDDDDDDGIDLVIQSRQNLVPETQTFVASSPPMLSTTPLQPVEHAQLSPRSAAALTSSMYAGRSSWGQPLHVASAISDHLLAMPRRQMHGYSSNPYFRRASISMLTNQSGANGDSAMDQPYRYSGTELSRHGPAAYPMGLVSPPSTLLYEYDYEYDDEHIPNQYYNDVITSSSMTTFATNACDSHDTESFSRPLAFEVVYADGGDFNESHSVKNVLKNDSSVYCSRRSSNINICLKLTEADQPFVLTGFKARAPTSGFTAPCKEGLIFVSHEPIPLERASAFDNMTKERYDEYMRCMAQGGGIETMLEKHGANFVDSFLPAAFFQLESPQESCAIEFNPTRSGRYVLIKLLRARGVATECPENIDVQYLGLYGKPPFYAVLPQPEHKAV
ncbi:hypothetical protein DFQ27_009237 [Actinomortierella ambigua]|uniref:Uncharacterized protein n=1 Tax=Actinomortierella ambigua TaxID=1343610 RepID=A0A9P6PQP6_9FUNG|nr:hypothetical protein DFQ27_009237 [Actinomortierella ambigua]